MGGLSAALCLILMFMTGLIPFADYALPAFAGIVLIAVVVENGTGTAWLVYAAVSFLSIFIAPQKEAALTFILIFGYYPILQPKLNKIKPGILRILCKFLIFNVTIVGGYFIAINLFGLAWLMDDVGDFGRYSIFILLACANIMFIAYDFAVRNVYILYTRWFRVKFLRKF